MAQEGYTMKKHDRDLLAEEGEALRKELRERTPVPDKLERPAAAVTTRDLLDEQDQAEQLGAFREREAIVKYLIARGEWDSTTGNCLYCNGVGFVDYDSQGIDQLCYECHVDLGELITEIEKGEHLK